MKKYPFIIAVAFLFSSLAAFGQYKDGYYNAMNGKKKEELKQAAKQCVQNHTRLDYYGLPANWRYTDTYPEKYNGSIRWWEMYSNNIYLITGNQSPNSSFSANKMQREHSVPKSWWKKNNDVEYTPAYTDLWNLYPSDGTCNQAKSNYPFGNVEEGKATFDNGSALVGKPAAGQGGGASSVFEPADEYKGDFARSIFYMATVYDDLPWVTSYQYNMFLQNTYPTLKPWAYETLLAWHRSDPVSQKEIDRNNAVETQQGNRNPFIDFPNLAEFIWGNATDQVFYLSEQGETQTPVPDESYIEYPENNEYLDLGQCAVGGSAISYIEIQGMIKETLSISISGADRSMFSLGATTVTPSELNHTKTYLLPVTFTPTSTGLKTANLLLYDGGLQGSTKVILRGEGAEMPVLSRLTAYEATDVTEYSYTANWSLAPEVVDYYVVNRTIMGSEGIETETLESDVNSLQIMRAENVRETYTVQSSRLGYLSEASNTIEVAEGTGIFRVDAEAPFEVETTYGAFSLISYADGIDVAVYDLSGRLVYANPSLAPGQAVYLPSGLYILMSRSLNIPYKVLVP